MQILANLIDFGMNLQEAGDAARINHLGSSEPTWEQMTDGGMIQLESGFPYETVRQLVRMAHKVGYSVGGYGGYQAILFDEQNRTYYGAAESLKDGQAAGY